MDQLGGMGAGGGKPGGQVGNPQFTNAGGKPGGQPGAGGGIGTKPGGQIGGGGPTAVPIENPITFGGGNPAWSPTSAETLLQANYNNARANSNPLNPVPDWYGGSQLFRGVNHPDPMIGKGRHQAGFQTMRSLNTQHNGTQAPGPPQNQNAAS
jgi:hypothetical protein